MNSTVRLALVLVVATAGSMVPSWLRGRRGAPGGMPTIATHIWPAVVFAAFGWAFERNVVVAIIAALASQVHWAGFNMARRPWWDEW